MTHVQSWLEQMIPNLICKFSVTQHQPQPESQQAHTLCPYVSSSLWVMVAQQPQIFSRNPKSWSWQLKLWSHLHHSPPQWSLLDKSLEQGHFILLQESSPFLSKLLPLLLLRCMLYSLWNIYLYIYICVCMYYVLCVREFDHYLWLMILCVSARSKQTTVVCIQAISFLPGWEVIHSKILILCFHSIKRKIYFDFWRQLPLL